jgi:hypothetical protein
MVKKEKRLKACGVLRGPLFWYDDSRVLRYSFLGLTMKLGKNGRKMVNAPALPQNLKSGKSEGCVEVDSFTCG